MKKVNETDEVSEGDELLTPEEIMELVKEYENDTLLRHKEGTKM